VAALIALIVIVVTVLSMIGTVVAIWSSYLASRLRSRTAASERTLDQRLEQLSKALWTSARLVEQISAELDARAATARELQEGAKAAEALAELNKEQAEAIRRLMDAELESSERRIRRDSVIIGIGSFIAGGGVSLLVTLLVHLLQQSAISKYLVRTSAEDLSLSKSAPSWSAALVTPLPLPAPHSCEIPGLSSPAILTRPEEDVRRAGLPLRRPHC
jgi:hypothetical protein